MSDGKAPGPTGRIATVGTDGNIYLIDPETGERRAITDDANASPGLTQFVRHYALPTWGPSRQLAYVSIYGDITGEAQATIQVTAGGAASHAVYTSQQDVPTYLYWAPAGRGLTFLTEQEGKGPHALRVVSPSDAGVRVLADGRPLRWAWSASGEDLLVNLGSADGIPPGQTGSHWLSPFESSEVPHRSVRTVPSHTPDISPDGQTGLILGRNLGRSSLMLLRRGEANPHPLMQVGANTLIDWAPRGNAVAVLDGERHAAMTVGRLDVFDVSNPAHPVRYPLSQEQVVASFWAPDGRRLALIIQSPPGDDETDQNISRRRQTSANLQLHIGDLFVEEPQLLAMFSPTRAFLDMLPRVDQHQRSSTVWSPNGDHLTYTGLNPEGVPTVYTVAADGSSPPQSLGPGQLAYWSWD